MLRAVAEEYLIPLREAEIDVLIMGCTHYPLIRDVIGDIMGPDVELIDPGAETVTELQKHLGQNADFAEKEGSGSCRYFVTDCADDFASVASLFLGADVLDSVERITLEEQTV